MELSEANHALARRFPTAKHVLRKMRCNIPMSDAGKNVQVIKFQGKVIGRNLVVLCSD